MNARYLLSVSLLTVALLFSSSSFAGGPRTSINGKHDGGISKKELLTHRTIDACAFKVTSFSMTVVDGKTAIQKSSDSNQITDEMLAVLKGAKPGSKVYFEKIMGTPLEGKSTKESELFNMTFTLK